MASNYHKAVVEITGVRKSNCRDKQQTGDPKYPEDGIRRKGGGLKCGEGDGDRKSRMASGRWARKSETDAATMKKSI